jgi:hypothetical protein
MGDGHNTYGATSQNEETDIATGVHDDAQIF